MEAVKINQSRDNKISEPEIIERILKGEKGLYEILVRRNNQKLYRVIRSYVNDLAEIEDLMQNTYLKAFEKLYQFKNNSGFSTWLIRIGINEALARIREKGKVLHLNNDLNFQSNTILEMPDNNQMNPEKRVIRNEAKLLLENAVDKLDTKYKTVYILREVEEMSLEEISQCLEISVSNAKVRLHRARTMLKEKLYQLSLDKDIFEFGYSRCDRITEKVMSLIE